MGDLAKILSEENCDLLVSHGYKANIVGRLVTWRLGLPQISVSRGWTAENLKIRLYEKLDRFFLRLTDHIVAVSHGQSKKLYAMGLKAEKVSVIHNSTNLPKVSEDEPHSLRDELGFKSDVPIVVSAGRLSHEKNFAGFIKVAQLVLKENPNVIFVIFGEGVLRQELESQILHAGLEGSIFLPGFKKNLGTLLAQSDIFLQTSFTEGLPNVVLEAFAVKLAVVATDVGGTAEVVEDGRSGYLVRPEETEKMADYITQLLGNFKLKKQMGQYGYDFVRREFNFGRQIEDYLKLYRNLIQKNKNHI
jgi:glycosyltransferase involved in cell wall biosynthesis